MTRKWLIAAAALLLLGVCTPATAAAAPGDDQRLSPFDLSYPTVSRLDPALLDALQRATRAAAAQGITVGLNSGWRSPEYQQQLFDDAVATYGSAAIASQYVASPQTSKHVLGKAVDVGPAAADNWLIGNGPALGLCQIYANEIWHFELASDYGGVCPPLRPNAAG
ncbi:M15 family metallopeptidase [Mycobacterium vicinigordonae]|nr:M15 family metallopeptidase [Mycobacterium vicinigordonae]